MRLFGVMLGVLMLGSMAFADLSDPGFEGAGQGSWNVDVSTNAIVLNFNDLEYPHSGSESLSISWAPYESYNLGVAYQTFFVTPGTPWTASVYARVPDTNPLMNASAYLETIFRNGVGAEVGKQQSSQLSAATMGWTLLSNEGTVSNDAVTADFRLVTFGGNSSGGTVYFDDAQIIPEPGTLSLLALAGAGLLLIRNRTRASSRRP